MPLTTVFRLTLFSVIFRENIKGNSRKTYLGNDYKGNSIISLLSTTFLFLFFFFFPGYTFSV